MSENDSMRVTSLWGTDSTSPIHQKVGVRYHAKMDERVIQNLGGALSGARRDIQEGFLKHVYKVHPDYGTRLAKAIGVPINKAKL